MLLFSLYLRLGAFRYFTSLIVFLTQSTSWHSSLLAKRLQLDFTNNLSDFSRYSPHHYPQTTIGERTGHEPILHRALFTTSP